MTMPKLTVSGYRGVWGESLTTDIAIRYAKAFGIFVLEHHHTYKQTDGVKPQVLVARDGRESGKAISEAIIPVLEDLGISVIDGDILPTPTIVLAVKENNYDGAIIITASHNPIQYNGLKFITSDARSINESEVTEIKKHYE
jgi:phosphomannomutase